MKVKIKSLISLILNRENVGHAVLLSFLTFFFQIKFVFEL